ncbi:MAG: hypothetical protein WBD20_24570 [Pirellulaceae bacterium]
MRYVNLLIILIGPCVVLLVALTPADTWRDIKFACGGRLLRRGLRFRRPRLTLPRIQFSVRTLLFITALLAVQQAIANWLAVDMPSRIGILLLTTLMAGFWLTGVYLASCNTPKRKYRETLQLRLDRSSIGQDDYNNIYTATGRIPNQLLPFFNDYLEFGLQ